MPTLFEIHITTTELNESLIEEFVSFCATIDAKPIIIELPVGQQTQQPMISKVVKLDDPQDIHPVITELEAAFVTAGFPVERVKVEVPLRYEESGKMAFPDFRGGYYEWHGKVMANDLVELEKAILFRNAHLSRNALKGKLNQRLITVRTFRQQRNFLEQISGLKKTLQHKGYELIKEEAEYCVYDTNKRIDHGWSDVPEVTDLFYLYQRAFDTFLRRVSQVDAPFMVKGSVIMRQYLSEPKNRNAADLDFFYLHPLPPEEAEKTFTDWLLRVTEIEVEGDEDVFIRSFREDTFWRGVNYSMKDDFPTTNTDILCQVGDNPSFKFGLDISWNLPLSDQPVPLEYQPIKGEKFILPLTVPLSLQISWKLHQSVVCPRYKDITDLISLLSHPQVSQEIVAKAASAYADECQKDKIESIRLGVYFQADVANRIISVEDNSIYSNNQTRWHVFNEKSRQEFKLSDSRFFYSSVAQQHPDIPVMLKKFREVLLGSGIGNYIRTKPR